MAISNSNPKALLDLTGLRFGRLTAQWPVGRSGKGHLTFWLCSCDCGNLKVVRASHLRAGASGVRSCGCWRKEQIGKRSIKHGHTRGGVESPTHHSWRSMIKRCTCTDPDDPHFLYYAGRGITVCDRWLGENGFQNFLSDLGERPEGKTLDRRDNDAGYCPQNCSWRTPKEQRANQRSRKRKSEIIIEPPVVLLQAA